MPYKILIDSPERVTPRIVNDPSSPVSDHTFHGGLHPIPQLQRTMGNRNIAQLIQAKRLTMEGKIIGLQRKLTVGAADDQYEQEADRVAHQVMNTPDAAVVKSMQRAMSPEEDKDKMLQAKPLAATITPFVQRDMVNNEKPEEKEKPVQAKFLTNTSRNPLQRQPEEDKDKMLQTKPLVASIEPFVQRDMVSNQEPENKEKTIQTKSAGSMSASFEARDDVETQVNQSKGHGSPLADPVRTYMEPRFGLDFSQVRVHTGSDAIQMNRNVGAQAFTHGSDIYFGEGRSPNNLELTAHELTHVVQQTGGVPVQQKKKMAEAASADTNFSVQRICTACAADEREDKSENNGCHSLSATDSRAFPKIARQQIEKDKVAPTRSSNCQWLAQRQAVISDDEEKKKISTKLLNNRLPSSSHVQRKEDTGRDGSDYVKLIIPDGTYVLEAANIPAEAYWELTYTDFADVYGTASQFLPLVRNGLTADPHTLSDTRKGGAKHNFKVKPGKDLDPQAGWGSAKVQGFRHGYVFDDDVIQAYLQFDTVPMLEAPGKEEHVGQNVIDLNPENHEAFVCPEQGKLSLQKETSVTVTDGIVVTKTQSVNNTAGGEATFNIGTKEDFFSGSVKGSYQRQWGRTLGEQVSQQTAVSKKLAVNYTCEGPGDFAFVPICAVWRSPLKMNVADKTGMKTGEETAYLYRIKYSPNAVVCKVVNGKVDPDRCGQKSAGTSATTAAAKPVLDLSPDEFEKDKEAQYKLFTMAKSFRTRMQALAQEIIAQQQIRGGEAKSILKRDDLPEFVKGVVDKCRRNGYKSIRQMDDIVRGRFDLRSNEDVNTVAAALQVQKKFPVRFSVSPQRAQPGGGYGYPRYHIILGDPESELTHEWQIGTKAVTEVFEKAGIKLPNGVKGVCPNLKNDLHDVEYDIFKGIKKKYEAVHDRHGLPAFHNKVDAVAAEAGLKGEKTPELAKKINALHKEASEHLQRLVDEFGADWIKQFCH